MTPATTALLEIYQQNCEATPIRELLKMKNLISRIDTDKQKDSFRTIFISSKNEYRDIDPSPYVKWDHSVIEASLDAVQGTIRSKYLGVREFDTVKTVALVPQTKGLLLPENGERSSSKGAVLTSGSFVKGNPEANIMRQFIWWTNGQSGVDIDTAVTFIDDKGDVIGECAYYDQRTVVGDNLIAVHSGDIVDGGPVDGKGAAEFLDIDKTKALEAGAKYAVLSVHAYSSQLFSKLPNVKFGYMQRDGELEDLSSDRALSRETDTICGEIYEPKTVDICIDLNSNTTQTVPVIYNLETDQIYWLDKPYNVKGNVLRNAASEQSRAAIASMINRLETSVTPTVMDLFSAHINCREDLEYADSIETADIVVCVRSEDVAGKTKSDAQIISALDIDKISAEWMRDFSKESEPERDVDHGMEPPADYDYRKLYYFIMESEGYLNDDIGDDLDAGDDLDVD